MREGLYVIVGCFLASVIAGALFSAFTWVTDKSGIRSLEYAQSLLLVGLLFSSLVTVVIGVPAFLILRRFKLVYWWSAVIGGFLLGSVVGFKTESPEGRFADLLESKNWSLYLASKILTLGAIGAVSAFSFWLIWKKAPSSSRKVTDLGIARKSKEIERARRG